MGYNNIKLNIVVNKTKQILEKGEFTSFVYAKPDAPLIQQTNLIIGNTTIAFKNMSKATPKPQIKEHFAVHKNNCFVAFHAKVWNYLTKPQKLAAIQWFGELLSREKGSKNIPFEFANNNNNFLDVRIEKNKQPISTINIKYLDHKDFFGFVFAEMLIEQDIRSNYFEDEIEYNKTGKTLNPENQIFIDNSIYYISDPQLISKMNRTPEEDLQLALFYNQPIEQNNRIRLKALQFYMEEATEFLEEVINVNGQDLIFDDYSKITDKCYQIGDFLFKEHFGDREPIEVFKARYKEQNEQEESPDNEGAQV